MNTKIVTAKQIEECYQSDISLSPVAQELRDRFMYHYGKMDGSYELPNSLEGDLLAMSLKFLHGKYYND